MITPPRTIADLVFVGFNSQVVALDRYSGEKIWTWKSPQGKGYVAVLAEHDRLVVSVQGYMYCLDPQFGQEVWRNPLEGMGTGVPCLASANAIGWNTAVLSAAAESAHQQEAAASSAAAT